ncbi:MAG: OmpA family protein [Planctomycetes bacterium]|nr:OmpA family protein [Planctomycetota bacterium]MBI3835295.1 OmpA family protein [Planctomycetota bacterium]
MLFTPKSIRVEPPQPHWLFTFGDMMAIIACVFIVMASMSEVRSERFAAAAASLHDAFGGDGLPGHSGPHEKIESLEDRVSKVVADASIAANRNESVEFLSARALQDGVSITISGSAAFEPSQATLGLEVEPYVKRIAEIEAQRKDRIVIRGHAFEESAGRNDTSTDLRALSFARAGVIASLFETAGVDPKRIVIEAHGDADPLVASPQSANARVKNRRVEIRIVDDFGADSIRNVAGE